jgi:PD-(D/E)XK nuclease superfamily
VTLSIDQISDLFAGLQKLPKAVKREPTFMEIAGYPHFENVCSNILAFYLQPSNEHGFGTLFLDTLAKLINEELIIDESGIEVRREEITEKGKRIDLVIKSDNYVFGIENKIFAGTYNDFSEYSRHLESLSNGRQVHKILLSLRSIRPSPELDGFQPVSYEDFFQKIVANIGLYFLNAHEPHVTFLRDFIQPMQNHQQVTTMDRQRLEYFRNNHENIAALLNEVEGLRNDMRRKTQQLKEMVAVKDLSNYDIVSGLWKSSKNTIDVNLYIIKIDESFWIQLDVVLTPVGWRMQFFNSNSRGTRDRVRQWLKDRDIEFETSTGGLWRLIYNGKNDRKSYEAELEEVRAWTLEMLKRLTSPVAAKSIDLNTSLVASSSAVDAVASLN